MEQGPIKLISCTTTSKMFDFVHQKPLIVAQLRLRLKQNCTGLTVRLKLRSSMSSVQSAAAGHVGQNSSAHVVRSRAAIWKRSFKASFI